MLNSWNIEWVFTLLIIFHCDHIDKTVGGLNYTCKKKKWQESPLVSLKTSPNLNVINLPLGTKRTKQNNYQGEFKEKKRNTER